MPVESTRVDDPTRFSTIWNMSFGFLGIQFGWGLQMANMSAIYEYLGATPDQIPMLWLAAPLTGLIVQPIIGQMSDRTWSPRLGRRRPYFLVGAILSSLALLVMPHSSTLWMAAGTLWILDASINISMEPFRAFVADLLPPADRTRGFAMQSFFIGLGAVIASAMPWVLTNWFGVAASAPGTIPATVRLSFIVGAAAFFGAVLYTILTTKEKPPPDLAAFVREKAASAGIAQGTRAIVQAIREMPETMRQLALVQVFTWLGLFCMWLYFPIAVARNVFGAPDANSPLYQQGVEWAGVCFGAYSAVCFAFAFFLPPMARRNGAKGTHALCLLAGAAGLASVAVIHTPGLLLLSMTGVGIAWASTLSMPYSMLAGALPPGKTGVYMGIFNFFIVIPEIIASLGFGWVMNHLLDNNRLAAVVAGGACLAIAALLVLRVKVRPVAIAGVLLLLPASMALSQGAPIVEKVEPPNWWAGHSINPVRVMIRGQHLAGAAVVCAPRLRCSVPKSNAAGTYLFLDVSIPAGVPASAYPIRVRTPGGETRFDFTVSRALPRAGRFAGFGHDDVVYLIMPDRFSNGDTTNDDPARSRGLFDRSKSRFYHGGDLAGIRQRLPYLKSLGITAIWLTPIYDNNDRLNFREKYDGQPITDYHGYGAVDFYGVEEHFGDIAGVTSLVDEAHRMGIKVIMDMVANHTGPYHPWVTNAPTPTWYHGTAASHSANTWQTWMLADPYSTPALRAGPLDGWFGGFLPDLNQDDPEVARYIIQNTLWWAGVSGIDGIRQDTWPYVPRSFWRTWMSAIKREYPALRVVGEVFDGDPTMISYFLDGRSHWDGIDTKVDYLFDFPLHFVMRQAFARGGSLRDVAKLLGHDYLYPDAGRLVPFLGNHDVQRFMNEKGATLEGLKLANTFLLTTRGTPLLYYGDEIGLAGGGDPDNRRDFPGGWRGDAHDAFTATGRTADEQGVWSHVQRLLQLRAERADLRRAPVEHLVADDQLYVYKRGATIIALNNDTTAVVARIPAGELDADLLGICERPRSEGGVRVVAIPKRSGCIFPLPAARPSTAAIKPQADHLPGPRPSSTARRSR